MLKTICNLISSFLKTRLISSYFEVGLVCSAIIFNHLGHELAQSFLFRFDSNGKLSRGFNLNKQF